MTGIFEQLSWLTKKVKKLCCIVENLVSTNNSLRESNPCYIEIYWNAMIEDNSPYTLPILNSYFSLIDETSSFFTGFMPIYDVDLAGQRTRGFRAFGGKNLELANTNFSNTGIESINDPCGILTSISVEGAFEGCTGLIYVNLPGITTLKASTFYASGNSDNGFYANFPNLQIIMGDSAFKSSFLTEFNAPKLEIIQGTNTFNGANSIKTLYMPKLNVIGEGFCDRDYKNFESITGQSLKVTLKNNLMICYNGNPCKDVEVLIVNNPVTIITT